MAHPKRVRVMVHFGCRPWERLATEGQVPESCLRCGGSLRADGRTYCAACHAIPGGEHLAALDDRVPEEEREAEAVTVGDTDGVEIRSGIRVPARFARLARG